MAENLSRREQACLSWAAQGKSSSAMGEILGISEHTVNFHIKNAMRKLQAGSRSVAAIKAAQLGIIDAPSELASPHASQAPYDHAPTFSGRERATNDNPHNSVVPRPKGYPSRVSSIDRIVVGVVPFLAPQSPKYEAVAFSLSQQIAIGLAQFAALDVTSPLSMNRARSARLVDDHAVRNRVDYIVDGALSSNGKRLQISVRLIDLARGACQVWSEHVILAFDAGHQLDDLIVARIVAQIDPAILYGNSAPERRYGADALLHTAIRLLLTPNRQRFMEARRLLCRGLEIEPENARILAWAAQCELIHAVEGWSTDIAGDLRVAEEYANRAIELDPRDEVALAMGGHICSILHKDFETALNYFDRAGQSNPLSARTWALRSMTHCYSGEAAEALRCLRRYRECAARDPYYSAITPYYSADMEFAFVIAHTFIGDFKQAVTMGQRALLARPELCSLYKPILASLGHLGRRIDAKAYLVELLRLHPGFTVEHIGRFFPFKKADDRERYMEGLCRAGVPERSNN